MTTVRGAWGKRRQGCPVTAVGCLGWRIFSLAFCSSSMDKAAAGKA